jgi:3-isopropylmalate/(R)-2-methylmalate dehydratase small subunit
MDSFRLHTGRAVPLRRSAVDTDQIIPAVYLKRVTRTGFADGLFSAWRNDPDFVLNSPAYDGATVLIAGNDFGTGSSREHAVWALQDHGFRVVIAPRFADIFRGNAGKSGLLTAEVPQPEVQRLWDTVEADPTTALTVDLETREIRYDVGQSEQVVTFAIDDYTRWRLLEGLDDISLTLRHEAEVTSFEQTRPAWKPTTTPVPSRALG